MFEISVVSNFSSAHALKKYKGKCEKLHGHNWKVEVVLSGKKLDDSGMLFDFIKAKKILGSVIGKLDHKVLNELGEFKYKNPSAENIAEYIFRKFKKKLKTKNVFVKTVKVWESETSYATYYE